MDGVIKTSAVNALYLLTQKAQQTQQLSATCTQLLHGSQTLLSMPSISTQVQREVHGIISFSKWDLL